jgi:hypothetical protein
VDASREVVVEQQGSAALLWRFADGPFIGAPSGVQQ